MFHDVYGLLEVKEWWRRQAACYHGYLRCDMHTARGVGARMAVATGLFEFTKLMPQGEIAVTIRTGYKQKGAHPQPSMPHRCSFPTREFGQAIRPQVASSCHLWSWLIIQGLPRWISCFYSVT